MGRGAGIRTYYGSLLTPAYVEQRGSALASKDRTLAMLAEMGDRARSIFKKPNLEFPPHTQLPNTECSHSPSVDKPGIPRLTLGCQTWKSPHPRLPNLELSPSHAVPAHARSSHHGELHGRLMSTK